MQGRVAFYGRKHLLQLVAIKRLQSQGLSLAAIQQKLVGATEKTLRKLAELTDASLRKILEKNEPSRDESTAPARASRDALFWQREPQWGATEARPCEPAPCPAVLLPLVPGASLLMEGVWAEHASQVLGQLGPSLQSLRDALSNLTETLVNNESQCSPSPSGEKQEKLA
jgi:hypothetical protein